MSHKMTAAVWSLPRDAFSSSGQRFVMLALADCHNEAHDECFPSISYLADKTGIGERQVKRHLADLAEAGWIEKDRRARRGDGTLGVWFYILKVGGVVSDIPARSQGSPTSPGERTPTSPGEGSWTTPQELEGELEGELESSRSAPPSAPSVPDPFDAWWKEYPRKVGKPKAMSAYRTATGRKKVPPEVLLEALRRWAAYWKAKNEPEFIPHPTTWLNQERWNDPVPALPRGRNASAIDEVFDAYDEQGLEPGSLLYGETA